MTAGSANLNLMIRAARRAARGLVRDFGEVENLQVSQKGAGDFVSAADRRAEEVIRAELMSARPNYGWLAEESGAEDGRDPTRRWVVDPLDGTTNYLHGLPHWAVSIALEHKGALVAAVVFDPVKDELFAAEQGQGAWMNDRRLRVSARREMTAMLLATGLPFAARATLPEMLEDLKTLMPRTAGIRRFGAASLDLGYVAAGRYDGFWERELKPWDMAAGILLVREAGGLVDAIGAGPEGGEPLESGTIVAANPNLFSRLQALLCDRAGPR